MHLPGRPSARRSPGPTELLAPYQPAKPLITLSLGEPQHPVPDFVGPVLAKHIADFGRYPIAKGIEPFRRAAVELAGEPLQAAAADRSRERNPGAERQPRGAVLRGDRRRALCRTAPGQARDPDAEPVLSGLWRGRPRRRLRSCSICRPRVANGFLPDLDALDEATLARTVAFFIASPANPQGAVASRDYFTRLKTLADRYGFMILSDECYSEIYTRQAPGSALECAGPDFTNVVAFQSLSKRSNLPGMRVGFAAGDKKFLAAFHELRNVAAPQVPVPLQHVAVAAYSDETHVEENRRLYRIKFDLADQILGSRYGYVRPAGGFCVWLDVSAARRRRSRDGETLSRRAACA